MFQYGLNLIALHRAWLTRTWTCRTATLTTTTTNNTFPEKPTLLKWRVKAQLNQALRSNQPNQAWEAFTAWRTHFPEQVLTTSQCAQLARSMLLALPVRGSPTSQSVIPHREKLAAITHHWLQHDSEVGRVTSEGVTDAPSFKWDDKLTLVSALCVINKPEVALSALPLTEQSARERIPSSIWYELLQAFFAQRQWKTFRELLTLLPSNLWQGAGYHGPPLRSSDMDQFVGLMHNVEQSFPSNGIPHTALWVEALSQWGRQGALEGKSNEVQRFYALLVPFLTWCSDSLLNEWLHTLCLVNAVDDVTHLMAHVVQHNREVYSAEVNRVLISPMPIQNPQLRHQLRQLLRQRPSLVTMDSLTLLGVAYSQDEDVSGLALLDAELAKVFPQAQPKHVTRLIQAFDRVDQHRAVLTHWTTAEKLNIPFEAAAYDPLVRAAVAGRDPDAIFRIIKSITKSPQPCPKEAIIRLLVAFTTFAGEIHGYRELVTYILNRLEMLSPEDHPILLQTLTQYQYYKEAVNLIQELLKRPSTLHLTDGFYVEALRVSREANRPSLFKRVSTSFSHRGQRPSKELYQEWLKGSALLGEGTIAIKLYWEMCRLNYTVTPDVYLTLVDCLLHHKKLVLLTNLLRDGVPTEAWQVRDALTHRLQTYGHSLYQWKHLQLLCDTMEMSGLEVGGRLRSRLVWSLTKSQNYKLAWRYVEKTLASGAPLEPQCCPALLYQLIHDGQLEASIRLVDYLRSADFSMTESLVIRILRAYREANLPPGGRRMVVFVLKGMVPTPFSDLLYVELLATCLWIHDRQTILKLWPKLQEHSHECTPSSRTIQLLLEACWSLNINLFQDILTWAETYGVALTRDHYHELIRIYCRQQRDYPMAVSLLTETMPQQDVQPTMETIRTLVQELTKGNRLDLVVEIQEFLNRVGPPFSFWCRRVVQDMNLVRKRLSYPRRLPW
ncbi:hypothetical protein IWQ62_001444 [Dispira parvispora]|uniref:Uncharacterized protein n=1 Tax=Dispira parvispora TaxID=1520584 RepID=A0A9W8ASJ1_9FUNG|nr:hypothetical protein IWQ62_001444 [Dispira parvispora]